MEKTFTKKQILEIIGEGMWENYGRLINEQFELYEGLTTTYPVDSTIKKFKKEFTDSLIFINEENESEALMVYLKNKNDFEKLKQIMDLYGWVLAKPRPGEYPQNKVINNISYFEYKYEARYDKNETEKIYHAHGNNKPTFLYHITPAANYYKIIENGLSPRTNSKLGYHPERVYFLKNIDNEQMLKNFISKLFFYNKNDFRLKENYVILKIDLLENDKTEARPRPKFYSDPNMKDGVFTLENIHPRAIIPIKVATIVISEDKKSYTVQLKNW